METTLPLLNLSRFKSNAQRARIATESWASSNLYCPNCDSPTLSAARTNSPAVDYHCPTCDSPFQLKSQASPLSRRIVDAAYAPMIRAIRENRTPNLFVMHYDALEWKVINIILIPRFAFPFSAIEKRRPLGPMARRAGWVGCNILLHLIPLDARIGVVENGLPVAINLIREQYARVRPLATLQAEQRGWTLDVLNAIRSLGEDEFSLSALYATEERLQLLHPGNRHVREKIRQQLQVLRDLSLLDFLGRGHYRLRSIPH